MPALVALNRIKMKTLKKNLLSVSLGLAMLLGVGLSFVPNQALAFDSKIPCWSQGSGTSGSFVACDTCTMIPGQSNAGQSECRNEPIIE